MMAVIVGITWGGADWAEVVTAIATAIIAVGVFFAADGWLAEKRKRAGEAVSALGQQWDGDGLRDVRKGMRARNDPLSLANEAVDAWTSDSEQWYDDFEPLLNFFEDLGMLEKVRALRLLLIKEALGATVIRSWKQWGAAIVLLRQAADQPSLYENFELLADRLQGRRLRWRQRVRRKLHMQY
jgi:hypothetical protein